jgi:hypothetical protein
LARQRAEERAGCASPDPMVLRHCAPQNPPKNLRTRLITGATAHRKLASPVSLKGYRVMDWIRFSSLIIGVIGLVLAIVQQIRIKTQRKKDYRRYWDIAKGAHIVMARTENLKASMDQIQNCPSEPLVAWGRAHEAVVHLVDQCLQNIFLQDIPFGDRDIEYWKSTGLLSGYLLTAFNRMRLEPPKEWKSEATQQSLKQNASSYCSLKFYETAQP